MNNKKIVGNVVGVPNPKLTKTSQLINDSGFVTLDVLETQKVDLTEYPTKDEMNEAIKDAFEDMGTGNSGENGATFIPNVSSDGVISWTNDKGLDNPTPVNIKGEKGDKGDKGDPGVQGIQGIQGEKGASGSDGKDGTSVTVKSVSESTADGGSNVVTFSDGKTLTVKNGSKGSNGTNGIDGHTPVKGTDYWTDADKEEINADNIAFISTELAKRGQLKPEFANSVEECTDTTKLYVLPDGYIYAYMLSEESYTNQIPVATDTNGNIYNIIGYKTGTRLSSSGGDTTVNGMDSTGFIPCKLNDVVRLQGIHFNKNSSNIELYRICLYDENKNYLGLYQGTKPLDSEALNGVWDDNGNLIKFTIGKYLGKEGQCAYIRICGDTFSSNPIVTINEEITTSIGYSWSNTGHAFVPADYEDRIFALEEHSNETNENITNHEERLSILEESDNTGIPDYVKTAAKAVARTVNSRQNENSFVFAFLSDGHCGWDATHEAVKQAAQAIKVINARCPLDCVVHGGDLALGGNYSTIESTFTDIEDYTEIMESVTTAIPSLWIPGNHDDAPYQDTENRLTQSQVFTLIGRKNLHSGAVCNPGCNYGYRDFDNRKVRVIYLDTHDKRNWGTVRVTSGSPDFLSADNISGEQLQWLANTAIDFSDKDNQSEWIAVIMSHAALNKVGTITDAVTGEKYECNTANAATILSAYRNGGNGNITHNGTTVNYDFSSVVEKAIICCAVHGHNHMYSNEMVNGILSIGCPNVMNGRERQSSNGNTYTKTPGTAEGTSFCIITVDRTNNLIYADHYGAGIDREIEY